MFRKDENNQMLDPEILTKLESSEENADREKKIKWYHWLNGVFAENDFYPSVYDNEDKIRKALRNLEFILATPTPFMLAKANDEKIHAVAKSILNYVENTFPENIPIDMSGNIVYGNSSLTEEAIKEKEKEIKTQIRNYREKILLQLRNYINTSIAKLLGVSPADAKNEEEARPVNHTTLIDSQFYILHDMISQNIDFIIESGKLDMGTMILFLQRATNLVINQDEYMNLLDKLYASLSDKRVPNIFRAFKLIHDLYHNNEVVTRIPGEANFRKSALNQCFAEIGVMNEKDCQLVIENIIDEKVKSICANLSKEEIAIQRANINARQFLENSVIGNQEWRAYINLNFTASESNSKYLSLAEMLTIPVEDIPIVLDDEMFDIIFANISAVSKYLNEGISPAEFFIKIAINNDPEFLRKLLKRVEDVLILMREGIVSFSEILNINGHYILKWLKNGINQIIFLIKKGYISFSDMSNIHNDNFWTWVLGNPEEAIVLKKGGVSIQALLSVIDNEEILNYLLFSPHDALMLINNTGISLQELSNISNNENILGLIFQYSENVAFLMNEGRISFQEITAVHDWRILQVLVENIEYTRNAVKLVNHGIPFLKLTNMAHTLLLLFLQDVNNILFLINERIVSAIELSQIDWGTTFNRIVNYHLEKMIRLIRECNISFQQINDYINKQQMDDSRVLANFVFTNEMGEVFFNLIIETGITLSELSDINIDFENADSALTAMIANMPSVIFLINNGVPLREILNIDESKVFILERADKFLWLMKEFNLSFLDIVSISSCFDFTWLWSESPCHFDAALKLLKGGYFSSSDVTNLLANGFLNIIFSHADVVVQLIQESGISMAKLEKIYEQKREAFDYLIQNSEEAISLMKQGIPFSHQDQASYLNQVLNNGNEPHLNESAQNFLENIYAEIESFPTREEINPIFYRSYLNETESAHLENLSLFNTRDMESDYWNPSRSDIHTQDEIYSPFEENNDLETEDGQDRSPRYGVDLNGLNKIFCP